MRVLVAYASRHGATAGIAERIAKTLEAAGIDAHVESVATARDVDAYDAFVVGSAAYMFHWLGDATRFVKRHREVLGSRPLWLFSSGPLGTEPLDAEGQDQKVSAIPKGMDELASALHAREHRVFFGAYDRDAKPIGWAERLTAMMPAARDALPDGDFRDWPEIEAWARSIAAALEPVPTA